MTRLLLSLALVVGFALPAWGATHTVGAAGDYTSMGVAVRGTDPLVSAGDTLEVIDAVLEGRIRTFDTRIDSLTIKPSAALLASPGYAILRHDVSAQWLWDSDITGDAAWDPYGLVFEDIWFSNTLAASNGVDFGGHTNWRFKRCRFTGPSQGLVHFGAKASTEYTTSGFWFVDCEFIPTGDDSDNNFVDVFAEFELKDTTFLRCDFDFSGYTFGAGVTTFGGVELRASRGVEFINCNFIHETAWAASGTATLVNIRDTAGGVSSGDIKFTDCNFTASESMSDGNQTMLAFRAGADSCEVRGSIFEGNSIASPRVVNGVKWEEPSAATKAVGGGAFGNTFNGFAISIGVLESAQGVTVSGNKITGKNITEEVDGIYFQDSKYSVASGNDVSQCKRAFRFTTGDDTNLNAGNQVTGNFIHDNDYAYWASASNDSASARRGNVLWNNVSIGTVDNGSTPVTVLATWQALTIPGLTAIYPGMYNSMGDIVLDDDPNLVGSLRVSGALPPVRTIVAPQW